MQSTMNRAPPRVRSGALSYLSLFTSLGTLLCCALPSLLVLFGLGATVASVLSAGPMARHHVASQALGVPRGGPSDFRQLRLHLRVAPKLQARSGACDPNDPAACQTASRFSRVVLWCSAVLYLIGAFTAYLLGPILIRF